MGDLAEAQVFVVFGAWGAPRTGWPDVPAKGLVAVVLVLAFEDAVDDDGHADFGHGFGDGDPVGGRCSYSSVPCGNRLEFLSGFKGGLSGAESAISAAPIENAVGITVVAMAAGWTAAEWAGEKLGHVFHIGKRKVGCWGYWWAER